MGRTVTIAKCVVQVQYTVYVYVYNALMLLMLFQIQENVKTLTQDRDNIQLLYEQVSMHQSLLELLLDMNTV